MILSFSVVFQVPRSSLPISPMHGPGKVKLKKAAVKEEKKEEEVNDVEDKSKAEEGADTTQSWESSSASASASTPR